VIVVLMFQIPKIMKHKIIDLISIYGLMIVSILIVTGITFFSANAENKKSVSCPDDPSGARTKYVLPSSQKVWLRKNPGVTGSTIRKAKKHELLRIIGRKCVPETGTEPSKWYQVELLDGGEGYISGSWVKSLNKKQKKDVEAWGAFQTEQNIEALKFYLSHFQNGFYIVAAKKRLADMQEKDITSKVESLRNELDELTYKIANYIDLFPDEYFSPNGPSKFLTGTLAKRRDNFYNQVSKVQERLESLEKELWKLEAPVKAQKYVKQLENYERIKLSLVQIKKLNSDPKSGLYASSILLENDISTFIKSGKSTESNKSTPSKVSEAPPSDKKSQASAITTKMKRENAGKLPETDKSATVAPTSIAEIKPAAAPKPEEIKKNPQKTDPAQGDQQPMQRSNSFLNGWGGFFGVALLTFISVGIILAVIFTLLYVRDLRDDIYRKNATIRDLRLRLDEARSIPRNERLVESSASLSGGEHKASRGLAQEPGREHFPAKPEVVPEAEQVDEGPTIEEFVVDYKSSIYDASKVDEFMVQWDVKGASRKPGTDREELGTLVFDSSQPLNQVDFWCARTGDASKFLILPGRKQATSAATLASDDGRPGKKLFRGIFEIIGSTKFELLDPALAKCKGDTLTVMGKGKVNLPTNSR
jgi:hypothetical protein